MSLSADGGVEVTGTPYGWTAAKIADLGIDDVSRLSSTQVHAVVQVDEVEDPQSALGGRRVPRDPSDLQKTCKR